VRQRAAGRKALRLSTGEIAVQLIISVRGPAVLGTNLGLWTTCAPPSAKDLASRTMNDPTDPSPLVTASRRLRRQATLHRRLISALLVSASVLAAVHVWAPGSPETTPVVVAAHDLAAGASLGSHEVRVVQLEPGLRPSGAVTSTRAAIGRMIAGPMRAGEVITDRRLVGPALMHGYADGLVATPLRLTDAAVSSMLEVGDRVDVYAATGDLTISAECVVTNAPVVALPQPTSPGSDGALVVLAVTDSQAARLAQAIATTQVSVVLKASPDP
jgi:pilus assembly protein CpaB